MKLSKLLVFLTFFTALAAQAASYEKVVTSGQGETLDAAIDVGLRRAVEQVSGVTIASARSSSLTSVNDGENSQLMQSMANMTAMLSQGDVKYKVLNESCLSDQCQVKLEVQVKVDPRSKIKDLNPNRRTVSISEFSGPQGKLIAKKVQEFLVQDRKFKVVQDSTDPALQYVISGKVLEARTHKRVVDNSRTVELTGEYIDDVKTYYDSRVTVEFRIVDVANNQIKWTATIPTTSSRNNLSLLLDIASKKVFTQLKDNIYPLVVLVGDNGTLVLNSGGSTVKQGQYLDVFNLGEKFVDPVTKETLGRDEIQIATVKVTKVLPKMAYLSVVKGDGAQIKNQSIARKSSYRAPVPKSTSKPKVKPQPKQEENNDGGIIL